MTKSMTRNAPTVSNDVGERWAQALAARDAAALKELLQPDVDFRAATPERFWKSRDADAVVDDTILGRWFSPDRGTIAIVDVESDRVGSLQRVRYQLCVRGAAGVSLVEQVAYVRIDEGRISSLRVLCSGYLSVDAATMAERQGGDRGGRQA